MIKAGEKVTCLPLLYQALRDWPATGRLEEGRILGHV